MSPTLRNVLAAIIGIIIGGFVNMQLIKYSGSIIPLPDGVDPMQITPEQIGNLPVKNFIMIFLAHALGTLVAAYIACKLAVRNRKRITLIIGAFYLLGGIAASFMIKPPIWYILVDLILAYFPMAHLGMKLAGEKSWIPSRS